jgi:hypothetical protein
MNESFPCFSLLVQRLKFKIGFNPVSNDEIVLKNSALLYHASSGGQSKSSCDLALVQRWNESIEISYRERLINILCLANKLSLSHPTGLVATSAVTGAADIPLSSSSFLSYSLSL